MSRNNQQRRATKAKQRQHRSAGLRPEPAAAPSASVFVRDWGDEQARRDEAHALLKAWSLVASALAAEAIRIVVARDARSC